jgi:hypothetical protein
VFQFGFEGVKFRQNLLEKKSRPREKFATARWKKSRPFLNKAWAFLYPDFRRLVSMAVMVKMPYSQKCEVTMWWKMGIPTEKIG